MTLARVSVMLLGIGLLQQTHYIAQNICQTQYLEHNIQDQKEKHLVKNIHHPQQTLYRVNNVNEPHHTRYIIHTVHHHQHTPYRVHNIHPPNRHNTILHKTQNLSFVSESVYSV